MEKMTFIYGLRINDVEEKKYNNCKQTGRKLQSNIIKIKSYLLNIDHILTLVSKKIE